MMPGSRIPTGRTWRDLPPGPPTSFVAAEAATAPVVAPVLARPKVWPYLAGGVTVVFLGFVVGLALPRFSPDPETIVDTAGLPDVIVPPTPTTQARRPLVLPEENFPNPGEISHEIFNIPQPPEGFRITANYTHAGPDRVEQEMALNNGTEQLSVAGSVSADVLELPEGDPVDVRGVEGVLTSNADGDSVLTWVEPGMILFSITVPESFGIDAAVALAESMELS